MRLETRLARTLRGATLYDLVGFLVLPLAAVFGCSDPPPEEYRPPEGAILLKDANNYETETQLSIPSRQVQARANLDICWDQVATDLQCHEVDSERDIKNVTLLRFLNHDEAEVEELLTSGQLSMSDLDGFVEYDPGPGETCALLNDFSFSGTPYDAAEELVPADNRAFLFTFNVGTTPESGAITMLFIEPSEGSDLTDVDAPDACAEGAHLLDFTARLSSLDPVPVPKQPPWVIDWSDLTSNGEGNEIFFGDIDSVLIAFHAGADIESLEQNIFELERDATLIWELDLDGGRSADLEDARLREGGEPGDEPFAGFGTGSDGIWLLALGCGSCTNPAPVLLTILEPQ